MQVTLRLTRSSSTVSQCQPVSKRCMWFNSIPNSDLTGVAISEHGFCAHEQWRHHSLVYKIFATQFTRQAGMTFSTEAAWLRPSASQSCAGSSLAARTAMCSRFAL